MLWKDFLNYFYDSEAIGVVLDLFEKEGTFCLKGKLENYIQKGLVFKIKI